MKPAAVRLWVAYGAGHFGKSLMWHGCELLFAFYLTQVCGIAPPVMAPVLAVSLFASGLIDVAVGHALRTRVRTVRAAAAVQALGACGAGLAFFLFLALAFLPGPQRVAMGATIGLVFRCAYAFYDVPQNAVLGLAAGPQSLRAGLSALRFACSGLAALTLAAAAAFLLTRQPQTQRFAMLGASVGAVAIATSLLFLWAARATTDVAPAAASRLTCAKPRPHRALVQLLGMSFVITVSSAIFMKLEPYFAVSLASTAARAALMGAVACGGIASQALTLWGIARWQLEATARLCATIALAGGLSFMSLGAGSAAAACVSGFVVGCGLNGLGMLVWTAVGNLAAAPARSTATLAPAMAFGLLTCSQKSASALGILAIGAMLDWRGAGAGAVLPVLLTMGAAPVAGALLCLGLVGRTTGTGTIRPPT